MRVSFALALLLVGAVAVGHSAILSCSEDIDCSLEMQCCYGDESAIVSSDGDGGVCGTECGMDAISRQRRSIGILARALGSIMKTLARWYRSRGVGSTTSTGLRIVTRRGGYSQAQRDFQKYVRRAEIQSTRQIPGGQVAIGKDGSRMIVRQRSSDGRPTLEFQNARGRAVLKYRYEP